MGDGKLLAGVVTAKRRWIIGLGLALAKHAPAQYEVVAQLSGPAGLAAALPQGSKNLGAVDAAIRAFLADGTIDRLSSRWLGHRLGTADVDIPLIRTHQ